jgi:hypothetical protein
MNNAPERGFTKHKGQYLTAGQARLGDPSSTQHIRRPDFELEPYYRQAGRGEKDTIPAATWLAGPPFEPQLCL